MANDIISKLIDAITASGKTFKEIPKSAIFGFLEREGIPKSKFDSYYYELEKVYNSKNTKNAKPKDQPIIDYSSNSMNEVKTRQPRKSIFSEIEKIAG